LEVTRISHPRVRDIVDYNRSLWQTMMNYYYLAPFVAVVFSLLLGFFVCFYYYKSCKRKEEDEVVNKQRRQQLNAAADCDFVEKNRSNSAMKDYFVVVHL